MVDLLDAARPLQLRKPADAAAHRSGTPQQNAPLLGQRDQVVIVSRNEGLVGGSHILSCQNGGADILVSRMQSANGFHHSVDGLILQDVCKVVGHHGIGQLQVPAAQDLGNGHILPGGYDLVDALTHGTEAQ